MVCCLKSTSSSCSKFDFALLLSPEPQLFQCNHFWYIASIDHMAVNFTNYSFSEDLGTVEFVIRATYFGAYGLEDINLNKGDQHD